MNTLPKMGLIGLLLVSVASTSIQTAKAEPVSLTILAILKALAAKKVIAAGAVKGATLASASSKSAILVAQTKIVSTNIAKASFVSAGTSVPLKSAAASSMKFSAFKNGAIKVGATTVLVASAVDFASAMGLKSSGSPDVDRMAFQEWTTEAAAGNQKYHIKLCNPNSREPYTVRSDSKSCLDGSAPEFLSAPVNIKRALIG
jgi:hypothetical protein